MLFVYTLAAVCIAAYLIGSINASVILSRAIYGEDIRNSGSGNAGSTNMLRTHGVKIGLCTLGIDITKGVAAILLGILADKLTANLADGQILPQLSFLLGNLKYLAGFFVVLGHNYPIFFGFRGGKGIATSLGVIAMLDWQIGLIVLVSALLVMVFTRYVSLGSLVGAVVYPVSLLAFLLGRNEMNIVYVTVAVLLMLLAFFKHRANIVRLKNGTESKVFSKKNKGDESSN